MSTDDPAERSVPSAESDEKTRLVWKTAALVVAMLSVWALGLGLVGRTRPDVGGISFQTSPSARMERRPALFAVTWDRSGASAGPGTVGVAVPIALIEPGGAIVPPIAARSDDDAQAEGRAFAATYYKPSSELLLLRGGAAAGDVQFVSDFMMLGHLPVVQVEGSRPVDLGPLDPDATTLLAISDLRFAGRPTGTRAMRDEHRSAVDVASRQILRDRYPGRTVVDEGLAMVRVADLDRDGRAEVLASRVVRMQDESGILRSVVLFLIAEPERSPAVGESGYRVAFAAVQVFADNGPHADIVFIDQADLTSDTYDEVVLRLDDGDYSRYAVLRRDQTAWSQVSSTPPVRSPGPRPLAGEKSGG